MARVWSINFIFKTGWTRGRKTLLESQVFETCKWNTFCIWLRNWRYLCGICWWSTLCWCSDQQLHVALSGEERFRNKKMRKKGCLRYHTVCSRSDNAQAKCSITSLRHGDIFSIYLSYNTSKLIVYSHRLWEAEVFTGVKLKETFIPSFHFIVVTTNEMKIILPLSFSRQCYRWIIPVINRHNYSSHFSP